MGWVDAPEVGGAKPQAPTAKQPAWMAAPEVGQTPPPSAKPDLAGPRGVKDFITSGVEAIGAGAKQLGEMTKETVLGAPQRYVEAAKPYGKSPLGVLAGVAGAVNGPLVQGAMDAGMGVIGAGEGIPHTTPKITEPPRVAEAPIPGVAKPAERPGVTIREAAPPGKIRAKWAEAPEVPPAARAAEAPKQMELPFERPAEAPRPMEGFEPRPQAVGAEASPEPVAAGKGQVTHGDVIRTEDELTKVRQGLENITTRGRQAFEAMPEELRTLEAQRRMYQFGEGNPAHGASPTEKVAFEKYIQPFRDEARAAFADIKSMLSQKDLEELGVDDPNYMSRKVIGKSSRLDRAAGQAMGEGGGGGNHFGGGRYVAPAEQGRTYFVTGPDRQLVHVKGEKVYAVGPDEVETLLGEKGDVPLQQAYASEIEEKTDTRYHQHALASTVENLSQLTKARDELNVARKLKADFAQAGVATPRANVARKLGWQQPDLPGWRNIYVEPRLKAALDKFAPRGTPPNLGDFLADLTRKIQNTLFVNPLAHIRNQFASVYMDRGFANVTSAKFFKYLKEANDDVMKQTPFAQEALAKGAGLRYPSAANQKFFEEMMKGGEEALKDPGIVSLAKTLGAKPLDIYNSYMDWANKSLWHHSDTMLLARIREKMDLNRLSLDDAIKEVHDQVADYRIPSEAVVPGKAGRLISQGISGRYTNIVLAFTRWHYATAKMMVMPAVNAVKGVRAIGQEGLAAQTARRRGIDAVGQMVAGAVAYNVLMGAGDKIVQSLSGDPNARMAAWGPMAYVRLIDDVAHGRVNDPMSWARAITAGLAAPSPFIELILTALGKDYKMDNLFVDKKHGETKAGVAAKQLGKDVFSPSGMIEEAVKNPGRALANQTLGAARTPQGDLPKSRRKPYTP